MACDVTPLGVEPLAVAVRDLATAAFFRSLCLRKIDMRDVCYLRKNTATGARDIIAAQQMHRLAACPFGGPLASLEQR